MRGDSLMSKLENYFDRCVCTSLPQRADLFSRLSGNIYMLGGVLDRYYIKPLGLKDSGRIKYDYIDVEPPANWQGRNAQSYNYMQCFFNIIQKAKDDGIKTLLYMEDDVAILPHFKYFLPIIMDNAPSYYDCINFGPGHHSMPDGQPSKTYKMEFPYLYRSQLNLGMQCIAISHRMFDVILELRTKPWLHENPYIDIVLAHQFHDGKSEHGKRYCYAAFPYLVCETSGMSYNERNDVKRPEYELWKNYLI
jgi:hypothetical protein